MQRLTEKEYLNTTASGIDKVFSVEYMGAAEFEFGALPSSLKRIRSSMDEFVVEKLPIKTFDGLSVQIFAHEECIKEAKKYTEMMAKDDYPFIQKFASRLKSRIEGKSKGDKTVVYWDIENDWFIVLGEKNIDKLISALGEKK